VAQKGNPFDVPHYTEEISLCNSKQTNSIRLPIISPQNTISLSWLL
jgi:hypothetical protein